MSSGISIRPLEVGDASELYELRLANRAVIEALEPARSETWWTLEDHRIRLAAEEQDRLEGRRFSFAIREAEQLVGYVTLDNIVRGAWQNAALGYLVTKKRAGQGIATTAVGLTVAFAFEEQGLHRVQAAVMPRNLASVRVLEKSGFRFEGVAQKYLQIAGSWEDHLIYAVTLEDRA